LPNVPVSALSWSASTRSGSNFNTLSIALRRAFVNSLTFHHSTTCWQRFERILDVFNEFNASCHAADQTFVARGSTATR
jgi:hypothetical protein